MGLARGKKKEPGGKHNKNTLGGVSMSSRFPPGEGGKEREMPKPTGWTGKRVKGGWVRRLSAASSDTLERGEIGRLSLTQR